MGSSIPTEGPTPNKHDSRLKDIVLVDQLPSDIWAMAIAIRPSGNVLVGIVDEPQLFVINSASSGPLESEFDSVAPKLVHEFENANACLNVCPLSKRGDCDQFAVATGHADLANGVFHSWAVWRVSMPPEGSEEEPEITKMMDVPDADFLLGMDSISEGVLIAADCIKGVVWLLDTNKGESSILLQDKAFCPQGVGDLGIFGINRVRATEHFGWTINMNAGTLLRFPIERTPDGLVKATGPAIELVTGLTNAGGLAVTPDGSSVYVGQFGSGHLWRMDMEGEGGSGKATKNLVRNDLVSPTGIELIYSDKDELPTLYILCCGEISAEALQGDKAGWMRLGNIDAGKLQIRVTVTTEVTYEYI